MAHKEAPGVPDRSHNTFGPGVEVVDGHFFDHCTFRGTTLEYYGGQPPSFTNCTFDDVTWNFTGHAGDTLAFMKALYHGMGAGGRRLIEETFNQIRDPI